MSRILAAVVIATTWTDFARAQPTLAENLAKTSREFFESKQMPGLTVGVLVDGQVVYHAGFGTTRLVGGREVSSSTLFHMASVTKPFVATAVMQLVTAGKVDLDARVDRYVTYFKMKDPRASAMTVRQLLTHTAGMPDVSDYRWYQPEYDDKSLERYIRGLADSMLIAAPGEKWRYSNIGFELLADLVAKVSGEPFETYMQRHILTPLRMRKSTLLMTDIDSSLMAWGHTGRTAGAFKVAAHYPYNRRHAASSTLHSNVDDMLRWAAANLNHGTLDGATILPAAAFDQLWTVQHDITPAARAARSGQPLPFEQYGVGLSWFLETRKGQRFVYHNGGDLGFRTTLMLMPDKRTAVVVLLNSESDPGELGRALLDVVVGASR